MTDIHDLEFQPPGPGSWQIDDTHVPRPWPRFQSEIQGDQLVRGFAESGRRYGLIVYLDWRMVNGFAYLRLAPVDASEMPMRVAAAESAFERKLWRQDVERWEREAKPATVRAHLALQAVDPASLDDDALSEHLDRCRTHLKRAVYQHHWFNCACTLPLGDFLAHATEWTGRPPADLVAVLTGSTPVSAGRSAELDELVAALEDDRHAHDALAAEADDPALVLERLRQLPGRTGAAATAWLDVVGFRLLDGHHVGEPYALERPGLLVEAIRARLEHEPDPAAAERVAARVAEMRDDVPEPERALFDELLGDARLTSSLRDERGVFGEAWAAGIARRAILELGRRLAASGRIESAEHVVEAGYDELRTLTARENGPAAAELAERARFRAAHHAADAPQRLGPEPEEPPPLDTLPVTALRAMRAIDVALGMIFRASDAESGPRLIRGLGASPGIYEGTARLVSGPSELDRIERGDVLVTQCTQESFNLLLPLLGAIVTDAGGILSHPAIVAREFGIPAVVGSVDATRAIPDGTRVRVDGNTGEVALLG